MLKLTLWTFFLSHFTKRVYNNSEDHVQCDNIDQNEKTQIEGNFETPGTPSRKHDGHWFPDTPSEPQPQIKHIQKATPQIHADIEPSGLISFEIVMVVDERDYGVNVDNEDGKYKNKHHFLDVLDNGLEDCSDRLGNEDEHDKMESMVDWSVEYS